jgi:hypothetical protein
MAKIESLVNTGGMSTPNNYQKIAKLMPAGEYLGKIVDVGYSSDKEDTRKILYITLARGEKEELSPRIIRARFDLWNPNSKIQSYAITNLYLFMQAMDMIVELDTDDPDLLMTFIENTLFKNVCFTVAKLNSQNGFNFNVVQGFKSAGSMNGSKASVNKPLERRELEPSAVSANNAQTQQKSPAAQSYSKRYESDSASPSLPQEAYNDMDDDIPF